MAMFLILATIVYLTLKPARAQGICRDMIEIEACKSYLALGMCHKDQSRLKLMCARTCGFCTPCEDKLRASRCQQLKPRGVCTSDYRRMKKLCPRTCGYCAYNCTDQHLGCKKLAMTGNCTSNVDYMKALCPSSCGYCGAKTPCDDLKCSLTKPCELDQHGHPKCKCRATCANNEKSTGAVCGQNGTHEATFKHLCAMLREECNSETFYTVRHYGKCMKKAKCKDEISGVFGGACAAWKKKGACTDHRGVMQFYCPKTCRLCRQPAPPPICRKSQFGCCWSSTLAAKGEFGVGCQTCRDRAFCQYFSRECGNVRNVAHMRAYCPGMCRYCLSKKLKDERLSK